LADVAENVHVSIGGFQDPAVKVHPAVAGSRGGGDSHHLHRPAPVQVDHPGVAGARVVEVEIVVPEAEQPGVRHRQDGQFVGGVQPGETGVRLQP